jgi:hypothetical protein
MLQIMHTDLLGPIPTGYDGKNYIMTVLDDYSTLESVVTMKSKDEASAYLIYICDQLENPTGLKIKAIMSDNVGEYINVAIAQFTSSKGIDPQNSAPYMPQSNGSAENLNYKLQAKTTAMLLTAKTDDNMWSEGIKTAQYVRNRSPHSANPGNQTPYGIFKKAVPSVKHFKVFGSPCYAVLPLHQRKKFGAKSIKGQFVGYELASKSYRVYYAETNQVRVHWDVAFNDASLFSSMKHQHPPHIVKVDELELYDQLVEPPPRPPVAPGQSRLDMFSSDE